MVGRTKKKTSKAAQDDALLVTQKGYDELVSELEERKSMRDSIAKEIEEARELGDLSENASYTEAMERKELNERRITELEDQISKASVVSYTQNDNVVTIGRHVSIKADKFEKVVQLVGATEADPLVGKISIDSPLGRELHNARIGDSLTVNTPAGTSIKYTVVKFVD